MDRFRSIHDDFEKEGLCEVLGFFVTVSMPSEIAVNRLPISFQQRTNEDAIIIFLIAGDRFNNRPVSCEESHLAASHFCLVIMAHDLCLLTVCYIIKVSQGTRTGNQTTPPAPQFAFFLPND